MIIIIDCFLIMNIDSDVFSYDVNSDGLITCIKNVSQVEAIEVTFYTGQWRNITLTIKGEVYQQLFSYTFIITRFLLNLVSLIFKWVGVMLLFLQYFNVFIITEAKEFFFMM